MIIFFTDYLQVFTLHPLYIFYSILFFKIIYFFIIQYFCLYSFFVNILILITIFIFIFISMLFRLLFTQFIYVCLSRVIIIFYHWNVCDWNKCSTNMMLKIKQDFYYKNNYEFNKKYDNKQKKILGRLSCSLSGTIYQGFPMSRRQSY